MTLTPSICSLLCLRFFEYLVFLPDCIIDIAMGFDISQRTGEMLTSGHNNLKALLPKIVESVSLVEGLCCLSESVKTRVVFQVVNRNGQLLYDTNFGDDPSKAVEKTLNELLSNPTYFNTALLESFQKKFSTQSNAGVKVRMTCVIVCVHENQDFRVTCVSWLCVTVVLDAMKF